MERLTWVHIALGGFTLCPLVDGFALLFLFYPFPSFDSSDGQWSCDTLYATIYGDTYGGSVHWTAQEKGEKVGGWPRLGKDASRINYWRYITAQVANPLGENKVDIIQPYPTTSE